MKIESGTGNGYYAVVDRENRLETTSVTIPLQHENAIEHQDTYQVIGEATPANGTVTSLHIKNDTANKNFSITYIRLAVVGVAGGTALPNASNYFTINGGLSYSSGGASTSAVNTYIGSSKLSGGTFYQTNPTLTGTAGIFDKRFPKTEGEEYSYSKQGSLVIPPGQSLTIQYIGDHTSGTVYSRVSYYVTEIGELT